MLCYINAQNVNIDIANQLRTYPHHCQKFYSLLVRKIDYQWILGRKFYNRLLQKARNLTNLSEKILSTVLKFSHELKELETTIEKNSRIEEQRFDAFVHALSSIPILATSIELQEPSYGREMAQIDIERNNKRNHLYEQCRNFNREIEELHLIYYGSAWRRMIMHLLDFPRIDLIPRPFEFYELNKEMNRPC